MTTESAREVWVQVGDARLHARVRGDGEPVVFVHGFPFDGSIWADQMERLPLRWRWIAPDLRGFGLSELGDPGEYSIELLAEDLARLLDALGADRVVLCGLSMGGYVAFAFQLRHSDRLRALVLADTRATADSEEARQGRAELANRVRQEGSAVVVQEMVPRLFSRETIEERPQIVERVRAMMQANAPATLIHALGAMASRPDATPRLAHISVPTLVLVGADDAITSPADAEAMVARIPNARLAVIPSAGHISNVENAPAFNAALLEFLERLDGGAA